MTLYIKEGFAIEVTVKIQMDTRISNTWWDNYRETIKITKRFRELVSLADNSEDLAQNMINIAKQQYPGKNEIWYLNKVIAELKQKNKNKMSIIY